MLPLLPQPGTRTSPSTTPQRNVGHFHMLQRIYLRRRSRSHRHRPELFCRDDCGRRPRDHHRHRLYQRQHGRFRWDTRHGPRHQFRHLTNCDAPPAGVRPAPWTSRSPAPAGTSADSTTPDQYTLPGERSSRPSPVSAPVPAASTAGGTTVTISGSGFSWSAYNVYFGTVEASANFVVNNDEATITAICSRHPRAARHGGRHRHVSYNGNSTVSSADEFSYSTGSAPTVTGLST